MEICGADLIDTQKIRMLKREERFYQEFREAGYDYTRGYIEGRKGRISNIFNLRYQAAQRALPKLELTDKFADILIEAIRP